MATKQSRKKTSFCADLERKNSELLFENAKLTEIIQKQMAELENLRIRNNKLETANKEFLQDVKPRLNELSLALAKDINLKNISEKLTEERDQHKKDLAESNNFMDELKRIIRERMATNKKLHEENLQVQNEYQMAKSNILTLTTERDQLKKKLAESDGYKKEIDQNNVELHNSNQQLKDALNSAVAERNARADTIYRTMQDLTDKEVPDPSNEDAYKKFASTMLTLLGKY